MLAYLLALSWSGLTTWITDLGIFMGAATASAVAVGAFVTKTGLGKPIKWLWKRLVGNPHSEYLSTLFASQLEPLKAELKTNGGSSLKDAVNRIESKVDGLQSEVDSLKAQRKWQ